MIKCRFIKLPFAAWPASQWNFVCGTCSDLIYERQDVVRRRAIGVVAACQGAKPLHYVLYFYIMLLK